MGRKMGCKRFEKVGYEELKVLIGLDRWDFGL